MTRKKYYFLASLIACQSILTLSLLLEHFSVWLAALLIIGIICDVIMIILVIKQSEKVRIAMELETVRYKLEQEQLYYRELEQERETMAKIRHDYNNLIHSVLGLLHVGRREDAEQLLEEMTARMEEAKGENYAESDH